MHTEISLDHCPARHAEESHGRERGVRAVIILTAVMMVVEIAVGYATNSMALLADGWHMATHVGALGMAGAAYALARRFAAHRAFAFGTGKVHALAGYTSAVALGLVAATMLVESVTRLLHPASIDFATSLPVAVLGLGVNLLSVRLLHGHEHEHEHEHGHEHEHEHGHEHEHEHGHEHEHEHGHEHEHEHHDHNHRAAVMHVVADTFTSGLAICALIAGRTLGWAWLDPVSGMVGGLVILKWGFDLCRGAACELLDIDTRSNTESRIRSALEEIDDVRVSDIHVWSMGRGLRSCIVTLVSAMPRETSSYRERILSLDTFAHLTVEVQRCTDGHELDAPRRSSSFDTSVIASSV